MASRLRRRKQGAFGENGKEKVWFSRLIYEWNIRLREGQQNVRKRQNIYAWIRSLGDLPWFKGAVSEYSASMLTKPLNRA
jgi:hypothetical protein